MGRLFFVAMALFNISGCVSSRGESRPAAEPLKHPTFAWDMAVCDTLQASGHCDLKEGASQSEVDISDNAFFVTVRSIGRGEVPLVVGLYKQSRDRFDGSAVGTRGRRVSASPAYQMDARNTMVTHKFAFSEGVLQSGVSYIVAADSDGEEISALITTTSGHDAPDAAENLDVPQDDVPDIE